MCGVWEFLRGGIILGFFCVLGFCWFLFVCLLACLLANSVLFLNLATS